MTDTDALQAQSLILISGAVRKIQCFQVSSPSRNRKAYLAGDKKKFEEVLDWTAIQKFAAR